jgi:hypothetical protein
MATVLSTGAGICFDYAVVTPALNCSEATELVFQGGLLKLPRYDVGWAAVSGPFGHGPLPVGRYTCTNLRVRTKLSMVRDGVGFSVDLHPQFSTTRTLLRIHPDGNVPGTEGCIGITRDVRECYETLKRLLPTSAAACELEVKL